MSGNLRKEVLKIFKTLHKTRMNTFHGDEYALNYIRNKINNEYRKYKNVTNQDSIIELNEFAKQCEQEVRTNVIQAIKKNPGTFELNVKEDHLIDNIPPPGTPLPKARSKCGTAKKPKT
ncbi:hypothetical protein HCN44_006122 [Aphidius gifuensis]|uniref:Complex III assembly factor LYRM7 n=1 Tax=Aphidius gifuensis TaxID=684658 RepID=A0A834Y3U5_APHGI|nr:complex III assembly factor LYRM7 [Aphidius gifuensis]KAF7997551.1 hypothetical protein HCN44_006122 [Aphidius gifuensis]